MKESKHLKKQVSTEEKKEDYAKRYIRCCKTMPVGNRFRGVVVFIWEAEIKLLLKKLQAFDKKKL